MAHTRAPHRRRAWLTTQAMALSMGTLLSLTPSPSHGATPEFAPENGIYTAQAGTTCVTRDAYATLTAADLARAADLIIRRDDDAFIRMRAAGRVAFVSAGTPVVIEQRLGATLYETVLEVRPVGQWQTLWMPVFGVERCEAGPQP